MSGFAIFAIAINGCDALYLSQSGSLERVHAKNQVVVLTTRSPLIYSRTKSGEIYGIDYDLLEDFAGTYGIKLKYKIYKDESEALEGLRRGEGDFVAARMRPPQKNSGFLLGPSYEDTRLGLFCQSRLQVQNIRDLNTRRVVMLGKDNQNEFDQRLIQFAPFIDLDVKKAGKSRDLIRSVQDKTYDCAVAEEVSGRMALRYSPGVEFVHGLSEKYSLRWILSPENHDLMVLMQSWFQQASRNDEIMRVMDRYQTYIEELDKNDLRTFRRNLFAVLPHYKKTFVEAAQEHSLPWQLVASVAYQESHWDPAARSFSGVRGLMQLTTDTAEHLGVEDRTDPIQSIWGGSKYLRYLLDKIPLSVNSKDRLALALAAYNIGYAHLRDAQKLARKMGYNPYSWRHMREVLPLLASDRYADKLEYGTARGGETVAFVERVKSFYNYMIAYN